MLRQLLDHDRIGLLLQDGHSGHCLAIHGRPGSVWIDIPLDLQAAPIDTETLPSRSEVDAGFSADGRRRVVTECIMGQA
jgi:glyoxylate carboligase